MPHTPRLTTADTGLAPVPVALLLPPPVNQAKPPRHGTPGRLSAHSACQLIAQYTRDGDLVVDLDANPAIGQAATWLHRRHRRLTDRRLAACDTSPTGSREPAALVFASLPRPRARGLAGMTTWLRRVRIELAAGGHLLAVVTPGTRSGRVVDYPTTVITAARVAGLVWQQHLIDVHTPLPEHEPRAEPGTAAGAELIDGRHLPVHHDLYVFVNTAGGRRDA